MASAITSSHDDSRRSLVRWMLRNSLLVGFVLVFAALGIAAPGFLTWNNLVSVILNEFTLAAIISLGMTLVISAGGIDLSVGSAADIASLLFIGLVAAHQPSWLAVIAGLGGALLVGGLNASLIAGIRISPLLATLVPSSSQPAFNSLLPTAASLSISSQAPFRRRFLSSDTAKCSVFRYRFISWSP